MLRLKQMLLDCGVTLRGKDGFCDRIGWGYTGVSRCLNHEKYPGDKEEFVRRVEALIQNDTGMMEWLAARELEIAAVWQSYSGVFGQKPSGHSQRITRGKLAVGVGLRLGDPLSIDTHKEAEMIGPRAMKQFRLFRNPFINDIADTRDIYLSEDHIFLKEMMLDTARFAGFTAVYGEVGSGKSVMRKAVVHELEAEDIRVVYPIIVDKRRISPSSLIDAIVMDISEERPKMALEQKTRQALRLLRNRATSGMKQVLIVEEAHLMNVPTMKSLKQIYELEDGFNRLIGIILIGQSELKFLLDETRHPEMREVTRRVTCAEIGGLEGDLKGYIAHKFQRVNRKAEDIFAEDAFEAMSRRLQDRTRGKGRGSSKAHPLTVNNLAARAMNLAAEMGEAVVTADVVIGV